MNKERTASTAGRLRAAHALRRWAAVGAGLGLVGGFAAADGNVTAYVDASGDLWMIADELDNGIRVEAGGDDTDTFLIRGIDATTTVNGQSAVTLVAPGTRMVLVLGAGNNRAWMGTDYGSNPSCCHRELIVVGGAGNDEVSMAGPFPSVTVDLGPGNDFVGAGESAGGVGGTFLMGDGDDVISVDSFAGLGGFADMGAGNDRIHVGRGSGMGGTFHLGAGNDEVDLDQLSSATFDLDAGYGDDVVVIEGLDAGSFTLVTGRGQDEVRFTGSRGTYWSRVIDPVSIQLGDDDDRLEVGRAELGTTLLDGGPGTDTYLDLGGTAFVSGSPDFRDFEFPKGEPGLGLDIPTRITGRVVAEGAPVPGAIVFLPEVGLSTATDAGGAFQFDPLVDERPILELVVGATVRGRARTGAARVELVPYLTSDAGDVVLERGARNVLLYGTTPPAEGDRGAYLEVELLSLGFRPEQVSRLGRIPDDLSPYGVVWHFGAAIPEVDRQALVDFVRSGRGLHLSGGSRTQSDSVEALANELVRGGGIDVGVTGTPGLHAFNPAAVGGVTTTPNVLTYFASSAFSRFITGVAPRNVLVSIVASGDVPGAAWEPSDLLGGRGHLTLLTNASWTGPDVLENLLSFLQREPEGLRAR